VAITRRGNRWRVIYRGLDGRQKSAGTYASEAEAKLAYKAAVGDVARERQAQAGPRYAYPAAIRGQVTVASWAQTWLPAHRANHRIGARSEENYSVTLRVYVIPRLGARSMASVTQADIRAWFTTLEDAGKSYYVLAQVRTVTSAMFRSAQESGVITVNPVRGVRLPPRPQPTRSILGPAEVRRLLEAMPERWKLLTELMFASGLRWGEVIALTADDIDGVTIRVTKTLLELKKPLRHERKLST
jgi:integrase